MDKQVYVYESSLCHHGIKGQKWGERRFQNPDGSLTPEGIRRYNRYKEKYGEKTAQRLMKTQLRGGSEAQAFINENRRRRYGANLPQRLVGSGLIGTGAAVGTVALGNNVPFLNEEITNSIAPIIGGLVAGGSFLASQKISRINDAYSKYDLSKDGLKEFYYETKKMKAKEQSENYK